MTSVPKKMPTVKTTINTHMKLFELFDTTEVFPYKQGGNYDYIVQLPDGSTARVMVGRNIAFLRNKDVGPVKQQNVAKLFNTIGKIVSDWMTETQPERFSIVPADKARERIYRITVNKIVKQHPEYSVTEVSHGSVNGWEVRHKDHNE